uniref:Chromo domain-containing protein n=1 Tax=Globisporangium ultimum (strain ATCC 200006 / CBS 805.95 / DAOM BR144) TaxID=431595 RepID=K3XAV0_GLOUD
MSLLATHPIVPAPSASPSKLTTPSPTTSACEMAAATPTTSASEMGAAARTTSASETTTAAPTASASETASQQAANESMPQDRDASGAETGVLLRDDRDGAMVSSNEPALQVSGGTRPSSEFRDTHLVDALVASGLLESDDEGGSRRKRRRLRIVDDEETKEEGGAEEAEEADHSESNAADDAEWVVSRILGRRGRGLSLEYLVQWQDRTSDWLPLDALDKCRELVTVYDRYLVEHPTMSVPFGQFIAADLPSIRLMADSPKDDCALHAVQMALELMGGMESAARELETLSTRFLARMSATEYKRFGGLKDAQD